MAEMATIAVRDIERILLAAHDARIAHCRSLGSALVLDGEQVMLASLTSSINSLMLTLAATEELHEVLSSHLRSIATRDDLLASVAEVDWSLPFDQIEVQS